MPPRGSPLLTDLYQLTMLEAYYELGMTGPAVFELFVRRLPRGRGFLVAAGLEQALDYLETLRFAPEDLEWIARSGRFGPGFPERLRDFAFTGAVYAVPEGTVVFADEPLLRVEAPLPEAQLVETRLVNLLQLPTLVASKAARVVLAAEGRDAIDFGLRRAHGAEAGLLAARAGFLAGLAGTSNVLAAARFGIPAFGTMAHSFVQAHDDEAEAFARFARVHPDNVVLLIDTFDTEAGAEKVVGLAPALRRRGIEVKAVRIDSGDLADHARKVRRILDAGGLGHVRILASGGLDEHAIAALVAAGAPIDSFAPGTRLDTSADAPYLDCAYKLVEYAGRPRRKRSEGKATWPGAKQVYRVVGGDGRLAGDTIALARGEAAPAGTPLLEEVLRDGRRVAPSPPLEEVRRHAAAELARLPEALCRLEAPGPPPVTISAGLRALAERLD